MDSRLVWYSMPLHCLHINSTAFEDCLLNSKSSLARSTADFRQKVNKVQWKRISFFSATFRVNIDASSASSIRLFNFRIELLHFDGSRSVLWLNLATRFLTGAALIKSLAGTNSRDELLRVVRPKQKVVKLLLPESQPLALFSRCRFLKKTKSFRERFPTLIIIVNREVHESSERLASLKAYKKQRRCWDSRMLRRGWNNRRGNHKIFCLENVHTIRYEAESLFAFLNLCLRPCFHVAAWVESWQKQSVRERERAMLFN